MEGMCVPGWQHHVEEPVSAAEREHLSHLQLPRYFCPETLQYKKLWPAVPNLPPYKAEPGPILLKQEPAVTSQGGTQDTTTTTTTTSAPRERSARGTFVSRKPDDPSADKEEEKKIQSCPECFKQYSSIRNLKKHMATHSAIRPHKCPQCIKKFTHLGSVKRHVARVHLAEKNHDCPQCGKQFFESQSMKRHIASVHNKEKPHQCETCKKSFTRKSSLKSHIDYVHNSPNNETNVRKSHGKWKEEAIAPNPYENTTNFNIIAQVTYDNNLIGEVGGVTNESLIKIPVHPNNIIKPIKTVSSDKKTNQCTLCDKFFSSPSKLKRHMLAHAGIRPYTCSICLKSFSELGDINRHIARVHLGEKNHSCPQCGRNFSALHSLNYHISAVHNKERPHICPQCKKGFAKKYSLKCHLKTVHGIEEPAASTSTTGSTVMQ